MNNKKFNMGEDLKNCPEIVNKIKSSNAYSQNMYAAMCNNCFVQIDGNQDKEMSWSCSWRTSGGIISIIREDGTDYVDWYCSGIGDEGALKENGFVPESYITEEIADDLYKIGWRATRDE
jgi:hypothetical protein